MNKKTIAIFDFDGTLIKRNTFIDFFYKMFPLRKTVFYCMALIPSIFIYLIANISKKNFKEKIFGLYLHNMTKDQFGKICSEHRKRLDSLVNEKVLKRLLWHKENGHHILIISASMEDWILQWAKQYNIEVIATKLEETNGILTGKISGENCYGKEKVRRFMEKYPNRSEYNLYVYGNGPSDKDILKIADYPVKGSFENL